MSMSNIELQEEIKFAFRGVPYTENGFKYLPLHKLPYGTQFILDTKGGFPDMGLSRTINNQQETDILRIKDGIYGLRVNKSSSLVLDFPDGDFDWLKPLTRYLATGGYLNANVDRENLNRRPGESNFTTFRLTTGRIQGIILPNTKYKSVLQTGYKDLPEPQEGRYNDEFDF